MSEKASAARGRVTSREATPRSSSHTSWWHRLGRGALFATAALVPWFFVPGISVSATAAQFMVAAICVALCLFAFLADVIERRQLTYPGSWIGLSLVGVVAATALATIFSVASHVSLFGGLLLPDALVPVALVALLTVFGTVFLREHKDYVGLATAFVIGAGLACLFGGLALIGLTPFAYLLMPSLSGLGFLAVLVLGILGVVPHERLPRASRMAFFAITALAVLVLLLMNFRELWVAVAVIAVLTAALGFIRKASIVVPLTLSVIALMLVLVGPHLPVLVTPQVEVRPSVDTALVPIRSILTSKAALVGTGPGTYAFTFAHDRGAAFNQNPFWDTRFDQGFSFLGTLPVTTGILGTLAWLVLFVLVLARIRRHLNDPVIAVASLVLVFTGIALVLYPGSFVQLVVAALALGVVLGASGARRELAFSGSGSWKLFFSFLGVIVVAALSLASLYLLGQQYLAATYYARGAAAIDRNEIDSGVTLLARAASVDSGSDAYQRGLSRGLLAQFQAVSASSTPDQQVLQSTFTAAVAAAKQAVALNPADSTNWANLGGIYEGLTPYVDGMDQEAFAAYEGASARDPFSPAWLMARARVYVARAQYEKAHQKDAAESYIKAQEALVQALELKKDYLDAQLYAAQVAFMSGNVNDGIARATAIQSAHALDANTLFQVGLLLYQNDQIDPAAASFESAVSLAPGFANARYFLGLAYSRQGRNADALTQFRWIADKNPDNTEIKTIIANLESGKPVLTGIAPGAADAVVPTSTTTTTP